MRLSIASVRASDRRMSSATPPGDASSTVRPPTPPARVIELATGLEMTFSCRRPPCDEDRLLSDLLGQLT